ncbi:GerMN domain-containing protein [Paeniglutamicibacter gangotriensis]|uniref:GerMN domain-containing protein n=1 Tax=Paeniglutamicibacter gangotriensis TaxID=254787 RepID=A0A5B0EEW9_9MICC|nr:GerMN domain-containing protein [Paeniglutamicibacter gangotriensis]KAA0976340.1 GerMN domain-containing protein [Paeniglutamicibacter gangotriensis]
MSHSSRSPRTRLVVLGLTAVLGTLAACGVGSPGEQYSMPKAATSLQAPSPQSSAEMESLNTTAHLPVYWLAETDGTVSLYREFVEIQGAADPIADSIGYMLSHKPQDPRYFSAWRPSATVGASVSPDNVITVDLSEKAFGSKLDKGLAERTIAQLVYTATAAASNAGILTEGLQPSVRILVDGVSGYNAFGQIPLDHNFVRDTKLAAALWVIDPQFGRTTKSGQVTFHGVSAAFSGGEYWEITSRDPAKASDAVVASGDLHTGGQSLDQDEFSFTYVLSPGEYTFSVWGVDAATGKHAGTETKDFTVSK